MYSWNPPDDAPNVVNGDEAVQVVAFVKALNRAVSNSFGTSVVSELEVIGEAVKRVSAEMRGRLASLDRKAICGMRDVLIHDYIGVDLDEVWNVASSRIPELQAVLEQFLAVENPGSPPVP